MKASRTKNAIRNIIAGFINKVIVLFFPFIIRTIMIKTLGTEYLGLNSLFTSILQVLNLAELGFSSAIVFSMYKPIAEKDTKTICALMNLYKKIYRVIGITIFIMGILLLPFLKNLINGGYPDNINIYILFVLYLLNTSSTYFLFAYKSSLLQAHQRSDITSNILSITKIIQFVLEILILVVLKNYYLYVLIILFTNVLNNISVAYVAKKKYPQYICNGTVDDKLKKGIKIKIFGLMIQKICSTTRNSLDSIFISAFLGLNIVTMYANYYTIMSAVLDIMGIISSAILAGVGNSIVTETKKKNYNDMNKFNFIYMWIAGLCTICLGCLYQPFMKLWMGEKFLLSYEMVILMCIYFYALKMGDIRATYSDAKGLWWENKYRAIAESIANIILNLVLVKFLGLYGIILGTLVSLVIINFGYGSQILFKHYFVEERVSEYFITHLKYIVVTAIVFIVTYIICSFIKINGIVELVIKGMICLILPNILYFIIYHKTQKFKDSKQFVLDKIKKKGGIYEGI